MWAKIKKALARVGWAFAVIAGILFASKKKKKKKKDITPEEIKEALEKARKQVEEERKKLEEAQKKIEEARKQTDEEVEHAKENIEVPSDPAAVADALNDVLDRARGGGQGGGAERQNCDGCAGRN